MSAGSVCQLKVIRAGDITNVEQKTNEFLKDIAADMVKSVTVVPDPGSKAYLVVIEYVDIL